MRQVDSGSGFNIHKAGDTEIVLNIFFTISSVYSTEKEYSSTGYKTWVWEPDKYRIWFRNRYRMLLKIFFTSYGYGSRTC
jgi:hypothetical protein